MTPEDKMDYMRTFMQNSNTSGKDADAGMSATPTEETTDAAIRRIVTGNEFALTKPATTDASPIMSPEGTLWVERYVKLGERPMWDVFDGTGAVVASSRTPQAGRQDPLEIIDYVNNTGAADNFRIVVQNVGNAAQPKRLNLFSFQPECASAGPQVLAPPRHERHNFNTATRSISAQSDAGEGRC